ncbi:annexin [Striga asiatica]|uniref:Annexin n=1 Tax=Striga asiatica TaxID=4170 RepID=A0A5A7P550_STRAF|nr:annexin [Striga asiatica]
MLHFTFMDPKQRYEGRKVNEEIAKFEAKALVDAIRENEKKGRPILENEEVVRILSTRSKLHLHAVYNHYKEISGNYLDEDIDGDSTLSKWRYSAYAYHTNILASFKVLDASLRYDADEISKEGLTRVIVTRADVDLKQIKEEYHNKFGVDLTKKIEDVANGNYRDFLLTLVARGD